MVVVGEVIEAFWRSSRFVVRGFGAIFLLVLADVSLEAFPCLFEPRPKGSVGCFEKV